VDELQRKMDADSKHGVFAYNENAAAAYHICELCGGQTDKRGESVAPVNDHEAFVVVVRALCEWGCETLNKSARSGCRTPKHFYVLSLKVCNPNMTAREVAQAAGINHSRVWLIYRDIAKVFPAMGQVFGFDSNRARGQRKRRGDVQAV
jgi:hypothetical protein